MTMAKRLSELLLLALIWAPAAGLAVLVMDKVEDLGGERGAYGLLALLVVLAWAATEYLLEALKFETGYAPE
jgi:hypothetical protein